MQTKINIHAIAYENVIVAFELEFIVLSLFSDT